MRGRKPKLTSELSQRICELVRAGNYLESAAAGCGIHRSTLHRWLKQGEKQKHGVCREFQLAIERAQGEAEVHDVLQIAKAAKTDWRAAAWRLERRAPRRYGMQVQATLRDEMESLLAHLQEDLDPMTFEKVLEALEQKDLNSVVSPDRERTRQELIGRINRNLDGLAGPAGKSDEKDEGTDGGSESPRGTRRIA